jgi:hypothetical protein
MLQIRFKGLSRSRFGVIFVTEDNPVRHECALNFPSFIGFGEGNCCNRKHLDVQPVFGNIKDNLRQFYQ